jgi:DNA-directed RNA polymerase subunit M/transcription elongation factor TFIIS
LAYAYQWIGELKESQNIKDTKNEILNKNLSSRWETSTYTDFKEKHRKQTLLVIEKPKLVKGVYKCRDRKCGSDMCYVFSVQTRGGDEGMTTFITCSICGLRRKE